MEKITQNTIKTLAKIGTAKHVTYADEIKERVECIGVSHGTYGINGALLKGASGTLYAIATRSSSLFAYV